jgi:uncharacterized protein
MRIAITGATGLVGTALSQALGADGHEVLAISRRPVPGGMLWNPERREIDAAGLYGLDAVVHLAGASIAGARWTAARKRELRDSRVATTRWFTAVLADLAPTPGVLVSASAVGIYGDRGDTLLDETAPPGNDFLARLATDWEAAADPARHAGIRVVHPRFGLILSTTGGALAKMLPPFRLGLGGPIGNGRQWVSWIAIADVVGAIRHAIATTILAGPVNFTTANPLRSTDFAHALGRALHRPAVIPLPAIALRLALGEMADATLLASQRVMPAQLEKSGYPMLQPRIDGALDSLLA